MSRRSPEETENAILAVLARPDFHYIESLVRETGLSVTTVSKYVGVLEAKGKIKTDRLATVRRVWVIP